MKRKLILLLVLFNIIYAGLFISIYRKHYVSLLSDVRRISNTLKPGFAVNYLSPEKYIEVGYGHCGIYNYLLQEELMKKGIMSRSVGIITTDNKTHSLSEVYFSDKWLLVDPMLGVVYKNSFTDILGNPELAGFYEGKIKTDRGKYYGKDFFSKVYRVSYTSNDYIAVPNEYLQTRVNNGSENVNPSDILLTNKSNVIKIQLPKDSSPLYISIQSTDDFVLGSGSQKNSTISRQFKKNTSQNILFKYFQVKNNIVFLPIEFPEDTNQVIKKITVNIYENRSNIEVYAQRYANKLSFISIIGEPVQIDMIRVTINGVESFKVDIGNSIEERDNFRYVYANEYYQNQEIIQGWGPKANDEKVSYRVAEYYKNSRYKHSPVSFIPKVPYSLNMNKIDAYLFISHKSDVKGKIGKSSFVKIYNTDTKKYTVLGEIKNSGKWTNSMYKIPDDIIKSQFN